MSGLADLQADHCSKKPHRLPHPSLTGLCRLEVQVAGLVDLQADQKKTKRRGLDMASLNKRNADLNFKVLQGVWRCWLRGASAGLGQPDQARR